MGEVGKECVLWIESHGLCHMSCERQKVSIVDSDLRSGTLLDWLVGGGQGSGSTLDDPGDRLLMIKLLMIGSWDPDRARDSDLAPEILIEHQGFFEQAVTSGSLVNRQ